MQRKFSLTEVVVASPLLASPDTAYGLTPVKEGRCFVVLALPVLDDDTFIGIVGVDR